MGGKIGVDSVENEGSRFWFVMPAGEGVADALTPSDIRFDADDRILVVDDHEPNRALVRALLLPYGVAVDEAVDGEMATAMAATTAYAAIIMDMHMPTMNGQLAAQAIKKGGESQGAPILAFSGDRRVKATAGSGFDGRLDKPISAAALLTALRDALADKAG
jgi:CheY-like chemotaxis protein